MHYIIKLYILHVYIYAWPLINVHAKGNIMEQDMKNLIKAVAQARQENKVLFSNISTDFNSFDELSSPSGVYRYNRKLYIYSPQHTYIIYISAILFSLFKWSHLYIPHFPICILLPLIYIASSNLILHIIELLVLFV
jgi:hypothetical protein